jgi:hypothetical protein
MRVCGWKNPLRRNESKFKMPISQGTQHRPPLIFCEGWEQEHICNDPKDGELCLSRLKPGETLVEGRSAVDVQITRQT